LESYQRGDLDLTILPRPLVPLSEKEQMEIERERLSIETDRAQAQEARGMAAGIAERLRNAAQPAAA
jgi:hypothetical protein